MDVGKGVSVSATLRNWDKVTASSSCAKYPASFPLAIEGVGGRSTSTMKMVTQSPRRWTHVDWIHAAPDGMRYNSPGNIVGENDFISDPVKSRTLTEDGLKEGERRSLAASEARNIHLDLRS